MASKPQEITLSDGSILELPGDIPDDQARVRVQQAEEQLKAKGSGDTGQPSPIEEFFSPVLTAGKELFIHGPAKATYGAPDFPTDMTNAGIAFKRAIANQPQDDPSAFFPHLVGGAEAYEKKFPVTPGYESWRNAGQTLFGGTEIGGAGGAAVGSLAGGVGAIPGAIGGAGLGLLSGAASMAGSGIGRGIDYMVDNPNQRYETILGTLGGLVPGGARSIASRNIRETYATPRSPAIAEAARRQNIPVTAAHVGWAKDYPIEASQFGDILRGMEKSAGESRAGIHEKGGGQPVVPGTEADVNASLINKVEAGRAEIRKQIEAKQEDLTAAAGGHDVMHDPWSLINDLEQQRTSRNLDDPAAQELGKLIDSVKATLKPKDETLGVKLQNDLDKATEIRDGFMVDPARRQQAAADVVRIQGDIKANTGINEDALRKLASRQKERMDAEGKSSMTHDVLNPYKQSAEAIRQQASGMTPEEWRAEQRATKPLYEAEAALNPKTDPLAGGQPEPFLTSGKGLQRTPERIGMLEDLGLQNLSPELAAEFQMNATVPGGQLNPNFGSWWEKLSETAKARFHRGDPKLRQNIEDLALLSNEMPGRPSSAQQRGPSQIEKGAVISTAMSGNPLVGMLAPTTVGALKGGLRHLVYGFDPAKAIAGTPAKDLSHLLGSAVTTLEAQGQRQRRRNQGER